MSSVPRAPISAIMRSPAWPSAEVTSSLLPCSVSTTLVPVSSSEPVNFAVAAESSVESLRMGVGDDVAHPFRMGGDAFALRDQLVDEGADAKLVLAIGPLERRNLAMHERLELGRPGPSPRSIPSFIATTSRRIAGADAHHRVLGRDLRISQAEGDLGTVSGP